MDTDKKFGVKDLPLDDRPREKLLLRGAQNLSDAELVAILLRTGKKGKSVISIAQEILIKEGNLSSLASKSIESLVKNEGIGNDKAATLLAAFEISRRIQSQSKWFSNKKITSPQDIADIFVPLLRDEVDIFANKGFFGAPQGLAGLTVNVEDKAQVIGNDNHIGVVFE